MNITLTLIRPPEESATILSKTYVEDVRDVERIDWHPHHIVFHFSDKNIFAVKAERVYEMMSYED